MSKRRNKRKRNGGSQPPRSPRARPRDSMFYTDLDPDKSEGIDWDRFKVPQYGVEIPLEKDIHVTTPELLRLSAGLPHFLRIPDHERAMLDPAGIHVINYALRVRSNIDGKNYVYVHAIVRCRDRRRYAGLSFKPRHFGMLIGSESQPAATISSRHGELTGEANRALKEMRQTMPEDDIIQLPAGMRASARLGILRPDWELAQSFNYVWDACERTVQQTLMMDEISDRLAKEEADPDRVAHTGVPEELTIRSPERLRGERGEKERIALTHREMNKIAHDATHYHSMQYLAQLQQAHLIVVDPAQVEALPEWEASELITYASQAKLPFECVYFDMEGPGRMAPLLMRNREYDFPLRGALTWREGESLVVCPVGEIKTNEGTSVIDNIPLGQVRFASHEPGEWHTQITRPFRGHEASISRIGIGGLMNWLSNNEIPGFSDADPETSIRAKGSTDSFAMLDLSMPVDRTSFTEQHVAAWSLAVYVMAAKVLSVLFFIETPHIELVEGGGRTERRRAEREGSKIATIIHVKHNIKRYAHDDEGSGEHIDYSHRFEVRGHYKHFPVGTQTADARPDLVRPCPRCGHCRRIWCPPFIKGAEDKPFVPKTRLYEDEPDDGTPDAA